MLPCSRSSLLLLLLLLKPVSCRCVACVCVQRIGSVDNVQPFLDGVKNRKERMFGFGHRCGRADSAPSCLHFPVRASAQLTQCLPACLPSHRPPPPPPPPPRRIYKNYDPRAKIIRQVAEEVFSIAGRDPLIDVALALEAAARADEYFVKRKLYPNVDFFSGGWAGGRRRGRGGIRGFQCVYILACSFLPCITDLLCLPALPAPPPAPCPPSSWAAAGLVYRAMGFPPQFFTVLFAIPRIAGYLAHWRETLADPDTKIVRPQQDYRVG